MRRAPAIIPDVLSRWYAAHPLPAAWTSTSRTSGPGVPVAIATLCGVCCHQVRMVAELVVASLQPCLVAGILASGLQGKTGHPAAAYASAAASSRLGSGSLPGCNSIETPSVARSRALDVVMEAERAASR